MHIVRNTAQAAPEFCDPGPGFPDPVHDSQRTFRAILAAMAQPGSLHTLPVLPATTEPDPAAAAVLLTLADAETPLWLDRAAATPRCQAFVRFHCGAVLVDDPARAALGYFADGADLGGLENFSLGTPERPDTAATVLVRVRELVSGPGNGGWKLSGPGIDPSGGAVFLHPAGVDPRLAAMLAANAGRFPQGLDCILLAGSTVACLPRSVRVEV